MHARKPESKRNIQKHTTNIVCFPFNNFKYLFTLFSKFFSSFPHGTCSLSVSCHYLALEGIYLPLELHSQATRLVEKLSYVVDSESRTGLSPSMTCCSKQVYIQATTDMKFYRLQFDTVQDYVDLHFELFPLHSPLLRESLLVSFPPLSYMLKFSGSSYLIWDLKLKFKKVI